MLIRDLTRHPDRPTTTVSASPVLGFSGLNKGVGSCIPSYGPGGVGGGYVYVETGRPNSMRTANLYIKVPMWTRRPRLTGRAARGRGSETGGKDPRILFCRR